jgi:acetyltransferase-like isoleucine patch superfamily enzyme
MKMKKIRFLKSLNIISTIYFNFKLLPLKYAIKIPVLIGRHTKFVSLKGKINIDAPIKRGMIRIGFGDVGIIDNKYTRTLIELNGNIIFRGNTFCGYGSKICVGESGVLCFGTRFRIAANSSIICFDSITFGDDVLFSWDILVMDTDFHETINTLTDGVNRNVTKPIFLGNNVWVGTRCLILKGTKVPNNTIVGAGSLLNKTYDIEENCLLGGIPAIIKKNNIRRQL